MVTIMACNYLCQLENLKQSTSINCIVVLSPFITYNKNAHTYFDPCLFRHYKVYSRNLWIYCSLIQFTFTFLISASVNKQKNNLFHSSLNFRKSIEIFLLIIWNIYVRLGTIIIHILMSNIKPNQLNWLFDVRI